MPSTAIIALLIAGSSPLAEAGVATVQLGSDGLVRVRDLARVASGGELVVMRAPRTRTLSVSQQQQAVRNRLPGADFTLRHQQPIRFAIAGSEQVARTAECSAAATLIPAGRMVEAADLVPLPCPAQIQGNWLRPVAGGYQARADIPAGTPLGRPLVRAITPIAAATPVVLRTAIGPVVIERQAATVQPGRPGRSVFARTADGAVLVAPLANKSAKDRP